MKIIELEDRVIYRADKGKRVKFIGERYDYSEIVVDEKTDRIIEIEKGE